MAIQVVCDDCKRVLRDSEDATGAEPEPQGTLQLTFNGKTLFHMDLCPRCSRKYLKKLQEPHE
ncbi:hypothetical protein HWB90_gp096 [Mycobacterium phage Fowlmouth]|uniref:Uncharacterized protein n=2 Tax=Fowlmouthvirus fowlmouth TaxID=2845652 RepID=A0A7G8LPY4_9CAUD|nr:hypothetical protein HWB90_gp096 [Mycobacterium phage Fowlmouth]AYN58043.1 hypothetical protein SEA_FOWLMOUTH_94 [Mycobacterium phage Fowlmouth]QNJ59306.1 hypothetical protein SEA_MRMIYAGI_93 [Mycobacterium phage MrMiyagi]